MHILQWIYHVATFIVSLIGLASIVEDINTWIRWIGEIMEMLPQPGSWWGPGLLLLGILMFIAPRLLQRTRLWDYGKTFLQILSDPRHPDFSIFHMMAMPFYIFGLLALCFGPFLLFLIFMGWLFE